MKKTKWTEGFLKSLQNIYYLPSREGWSTPPWWCIGKQSAWRTKCCQKTLCQNWDPESKKRGNWLIVWRSKNTLISAFCVCANGFQDLSKAFHYPIQLLTFYLLLWNKFLLILNCLLKLLRIPFSVIGRCSLVPSSHWLEGKCARINLSQASFVMILQNHRRLSVNIFSAKTATLGPFKRVTGRVFKISK